MYREVRDNTILSHTTIPDLTAHSYQYSEVRYFTTSTFPRFFLSASHRSNHFAIFPLDVSLPTLTVAIIRAQSNDSAKHVSSKNELCSEYGTPYTCKVDVELRIGCIFAWVNVRLWEREMTLGIDGSVSKPFGAVNLQGKGIEVSLLECDEEDW